MWMVLTILSLRFIVGIVILSLLLAILGCTEVGRQLGQRRVARLGESALEGFGAVEGGIFALLGLLLAFTFSAAASRFDARKDLIVQEANVIDTAYLRLDLLPRASQPELRRLFGRYVDTRLSMLASISHLRYPTAELQQQAELQREIWEKAVAGSQASRIPQTMLLVLPAINEMIDITTVRNVAVRWHVPWLVLVLLVLLTFASSVLAGYGMAHVKSRSWAHMVAFAVILAITVYVILDYEFPRLGLIRLDWVDGVLVDVRKTMP
jgi:hypothetical protein